MAGNGVKVALSDGMTMRELLLAAPSIILIGSANAVMKWRLTSTNNESVAGDLAQKIIRLVSDPFLFAAVIGTIASILWWLYIISRVRVSVVYPMIQAGAIVFTSALAAVFLQEKINGEQLTGMLLVISGIFFLAASR
ncbi:EamA family transporter [Synechococcus sp. LTW-R]|uniref:EamA family transporter n=1 Tax=Synechococcus sp. LTW-R TaxID=2751170 RepID=UPI00162AA14A|nr:EamA family transporter [Synechococcus sp. LTW-R]QNG28907.1 EamA family transporter [Synechococcus sp. LTW-R]